MSRKLSLILRRIAHRAVMYPILTPVILGYMLTNDSRLLDLFYSIRSIIHGFPMKGGLRLAAYGGNKIVFPSGEDPSFDDVFLRDVYSPYEPKHEDIVIDVGAHMGFFTVKVAKHVAKVIAIEPDPYNFSFLSANINRNKFSNVRVFNLAIGAKTGHMFLKRSYGYGRTKLSEDNNCECDVIVRSLDDLLGELSIVPNLIKIDTEGYEMKVLEGAKSILTCCKPRLIIASYHYPNEWKDVARLLIDFGFRCFVYYRPLELQKIKEAYIYAIPF